MKASHRFLPLILATAIAAAALPGCNSVKGSSKPAAKSADTASHPVEPVVTFKDLEGKDIALDSLKGKVVLVNFWATWCDPCRAEIPDLIEFQNRYSAKGFTVLGIAMDEEGKSVVDPFVHKEQFDVQGQKLTMNYPIVLGDDDIAAKFGGMLGYPTSWLISRDGKMMKHIIGGVSADQMEKEIQALL
jgi:cytochrome c biogenesis protein CcmG, thiol:disulfide interchange protein DsbE